MFYKAYNVKITPTAVATKIFANSFNCKLKDYANESIKKSIKNIEERYKDPNYKSRLALSKVFADGINSENKKTSAIKVLIGATTISFSLYLVYSFMKRYRT
jgi:hypothetical protein